MLITGSKVKLLSMMTITYRKKLKKIEPSDMETFFSCIYNSWNFNFSKNLRTYSKQNNSPVINSIIKTK